MAKQSDLGKVSLRSGARYSALGISSPRFQAKFSYLIYTRGTGMKCNFQFVFFLAFMVSDESGGETYH